MLSRTGRRQWFDLGGGELLLLVVVLAFIWWQAVRAPVHVAGERQAAAAKAGAEQTVDRPPTSNEVLARGSVASVIAVAGCLGGRWLIRRAARRE
jgi:hypothetical protein